MLRQLRLFSAGLGASALAVAASGMLHSTAAMAQTSGGAAQVAPVTSLSVDQARAAALRILKAVQSGDANARYAQFSPERQAITSPALIAATMRTQPKVRSFELLSVRSGMVHQHGGSGTRHRSGQTGRVHGAQQRWSARALLRRSRRRCLQ